MLSRTAERLYWFGRYVERAEATARLINVNASLSLDLPQAPDRIWANLIGITGSGKAFRDNYGKADEGSVMRFMLGDESNPASLGHSVRMARENARVSREIMPLASWTTINELHLYVRKNADRGMKRERRHQYLNNVIMFCSQITGLLFSGMSHGNAYSFVRAGRNLERADMSSRVIDMGYLDLQTRADEDSDALDDLLWSSVLHSLSSYQIYRQHVKERVNGEDVVNFLLKYEDLPRSVLHCLGEIRARFARLPENQLPLESLARVREQVESADVVSLMEDNKLRGFIDETQKALIALHEEVERAWFAPE